MSYYTYIKAFGTGASEVMGDVACPNNDQLNSVLWHPHDRRKLAFTSCLLISTYLHANTHTHTHTHTHQACMSIYQSEAELSTCSLLSVSYEWHNFQLLLLFFFVVVVVIIILQKLKSTGSW